MDDKFQNQHNLDESLYQLEKELGRQVSLELESPPVEVSKKKRFTPRLAVVIICIFGMLGISVFTIGNYFLGRVNYESEADVERIPEEEGAPVANAKEIELPDENDFVGSNKNVINILLIGEESMDTSRGRSDVMILATINQEQKSLKLTSFMRDIYVQIPGYRNNKLNASYSLGGGPLLCETLALNFNVEIDGYVRVNFNSFESIIDKVGGVEIDLTEAEAKYLNTTNYISNPSYRNVVPGTQTLNGNQALGYSRIRYRKGINGERDDYGRTARQRIVINAIFNKYKSKNIVELATLANDLLPDVTTNITKTDILSYLTAAVSLGTTELETFRIPVDNGHTSEDVLIGSRYANVLITDMPLNSQELSNFIYGETN